MDLSNSKYIYLPQKIEADTDMNPTEEMKSKLSHLDCNLTRRYIDVPLRWGPLAFTHIKCGRGFFLQSNMRLFMIIHSSCR